MPRLCATPSHAETARVAALFQALQTHNPNPTTELIAHTPFQLLVAVVLSAQMTDAGVNKATAPLFQTVKTPQDVLDMGEEALANALKSINYWRTKARHVVALSQQLVVQFGGQVPHTREALQSLPGVGRKTANVVLNVLYGAPTMPVDTHVFRVAHRLGLAMGKTPEGVEEELYRIIPQTALPHAHHWLILLGRYTCTARAPKCGQCPVACFCPSRASGAT